RGRRDPGRDAQEPPRPWRPVPSREHRLGEWPCAAGKFPQADARLMDLDALINEARAPLSRDDTESLFQSIFRGALNEAQLVAYRTATADRKPSVDELVGAVSAMRSHMRPVIAPAGAIDLCGTGGDGLGTLNISTAVSFVVAAAGIVVAKHGN